MTFKGHAACRSLGTPPALRRGSLHYEDEGVGGRRNLVVIQKQVSWPRAGTLSGIWLNQGDQRESEA